MAFCPIPRWLPGHMETSGSSGGRRPSCDRVSHSPGPLHTPLFSTGSMYPSVMGRVTKPAISMCAPCSAAADRLSTRFACISPGSLPARHMRLVARPVLTSSARHARGARPAHSGLVVGEQAAASPPGRAESPPCVSPRSARPSRIARPGLGSPTCDPMIADNLLEIADTKSE